MIRAWARNPLRLTCVSATAIAGLLAGALIFQYGFGMAPCAMCIWQRWAHLAALIPALGALFLLQRQRPGGGALLIIAVLAELTGAALALWHAGVEQKWWLGPQTCTASADRAALSTEDLLAEILATPLVRCDEIAWSLAGLSMAAWNMIFSLIIAGALLAAFTRLWRSPGL